MAPPPTLPTELLIKIVKLAASTPTFDFSSSDWAIEEDLGLFSALCLSSSTFYDIAAPHLYAHPVLPTQAAREAFVQTLRSERWTTGALAGKAAEWVKTATIGRGVAAGAEAEGEFVAAVLKELGNTRVEQVALVGVKVGRDSLAKIQSVRRLLLDQVVLNVSRRPGCCLPALTHLRLSDTRPLNGAPRWFFPKVQLPALTHLSWTVTSQLPQAESLTLRDSGLDAVAGHLEHLAMHEVTARLGEEAWLYAPLMTHLTELVVSGVGNLAVPGELGKTLRRLPRSLRTLDLAGRPIIMSNAFLQDVTKSLFHKWGGVSELEVLRLPDARTRGGLGLAHSWEASGVTAELYTVGEDAEKRGVRVEWFGPPSFLFRYPTHRPQLGPMPGPTLPTELLIKIINLAAPEPNFDFAQQDWSTGVEQSTLYALCLTSSVFNELATPLLYRHLVVPTAKAGKALVKTLQSDRRQAGHMAGKAQQWVRSVALGEGEQETAQGEGGFVGLVLAQLAGSGMERVAVVGLKVDRGVLSQVAGLRMQFLRLDRVVTDFEEGASVSLTRLSHLHLTDLTTPVPDPSDSFRFTRAVTSFLLCPNLTHLVCTELGSAQLDRRDRRPRLLIFPPAAPSLRSVTFTCESAVLLLVLVPAASTLIALRELALGRVDPEWLLEEGVPLLLEGLPYSLEVLEMSAVGPPDLAARAVGGSLERGERGVSGLRVLRLARGEAEAGGELSSLVEVAEARGVKIGWV